MKKYYNILGLDENASIVEVEEKYNLLIEEFDPEKQSEEFLKVFFKSKQDSVIEAYLQISSSFKVNKDQIFVSEVDEIDTADSNYVLMCYKTLKLSEDSTLTEINEKYNILLDEFNPDHQSDNIKDFFEKEQEKVKEAYSTIIKYLSAEESEEISDKFINESVEDSKFQDLGDYKVNDDVKYCRFCGEMQNMTNSECINCLGSFDNSFSKLFDTNIIVESGEVNKMFSAPFSFNGRIRRLEYFLSLLIFCFFCLFLSLLIDEYRLAEAYFFFFIPPFWFLFSQGSKRLHDCWMSGWLQLIPWVNIFLYIFLIFKKGKIGKNKYGSNPKGLNYELLKG